MTTAEALILGALIIFALIMTYFAFTRRNMAVSFVAAIVWLLLLIYTRSNPLPNMATGSTGDEVVLWVCMLMMPILLFNAWIKQREDKKTSYYSDSGEYVGKYEKPEIKPDNHIETSEEHRQRLHNRIMNARARRRQYRG